MPGEAGGWRSAPGRNRLRVTSHYPLSNYGALVRRFQKPAQMRPIRGIGSEVSKAGPDAVFPDKMDLAAEAAEAPQGAEHGFLVPSLNVTHFPLPDPSNPAFASMATTVQMPPSGAVPPWPNSISKSPAAPLMPPHEAAKPGPAEAVDEHMMYAVSLEDVRRPPRGGIADAAAKREVSSRGGTPVVNDVLKIVQQPASHGRFRYSKEGRKTPLHGRVEGSFPAVAVSEAFRHVVDDGTHVDVSLVTKHDDEHGGPVRHWHVLEGKDGGTVSRPLKDGVATFPNLVVTRTTAEKEGGARNVEDQHVIRLLYSMLFRDASGRMAEARAISEPIYGLEVKIHRVSHTQIPATGNVDVFFLTSKIKKKNTILKFTEVEPSAFDPGATRPMATGQGQLPDVLHARLDGPHWDPSITSPRAVKVCLIDTVQGLKSNTIEIQYVPAPHRIYSASAPPMFAMPTQSHAWGAPHIDWLGTPESGAAQEGRGVSESPSASSESTDTGRSSRVYGGHETSV
eukprot:CAMPEP_0206328986 /NCGR_PEP_ID=MMETSP0106_2-20121207/22963_1 /ASSEMBLY_ACC=CAM_ASM_000206 /TAXON_ID=81532 /ORGANISM="Acanthoeca-like sp., Strain 10tr" /LENGTH=509 /DNA_ID=CAMNT_0053761685 /DNA_START=363 /DNA_END=1891 /DNA_ORIENTATION=+